MKVTVKFLGLQKVETKLDKYDLLCREGARAKDVMCTLKVLFPNLSFGEVICVNARQVDALERLKHEDELMFVPTIGGG